MSHASRIADQLRMAADDEDLPEEERERLRQRADEITDEDTNMTDNTDETDESTETETTEDAPIGAEFDVPLPGMLALDRTDLEGNRMVIVCLRQRRAGTMTVAATGKTIAEHQSEWEEAEWAEDVERQPVVDVVYKGALEERWEDEWQEWPASWLTYRVGNEGMRTYSFPVGRLLFGREYAAVVEKQGREPASTLTEDPAEPDVACTECGETWVEGDTKADYALHFGECPECSGEIEGRLVDKEDGDLVTDGGLYRASTEGMAFDGVEVDLTTRATEAGAEAEDKAEKVHMDLKARFQQIAQAYEEGQHPDEGTPFMSVDWESVLGLTEEDNE